MHILDLELSSVNLHASPKVLLCLTLYRTRLGKDLLANLLDYFHEVFV